MRCFAASSGTVVPSTAISVIDPPSGWASWEAMFGL